MHDNSSFFTISIDFELFWGMRDVTTIEKYGQNILGGRKAIPKILNLFHEYKINSTWGVVGLAIFQDRDEMENSFPSELPIYKNKNLSPYEHIKTIGKNEDEDPYHFGYSLFDLIKSSSGTEIASHSFSHFYCNEERTNELAFISDLAASKEVLNKYDVNPISFIFCRNQYTEKDLEDLFISGYKNFRGLEDTNYANPKAGYASRTIRLTDSFLNLTGNNTLFPLVNSGLVNVPASRFLRPVSEIDFKLLRLRRIKNSMTEAAKQGRGYHLWWHPHNFGTNTQGNLSILKNILDHFSELNDKYGFRSLNMSQASRLI